MGGASSSRSSSSLSTDRWPRPGALRPRRRPGFQEEPAGGRETDLPRPAHGSEGAHRRSRLPDARGRRDRPQARGARLPERWPAERWTSARPEVGDRAARLAAGGEDGGRRRIGAALPRLEKLVRDAPEMVDAWVLLGDARRLFGDFEEALAAYREALELSPRPPTPRSAQRGRCATSAGSTRRAATPSSPSRPRRPPPIAPSRRSRSRPATPPPRSAKRGWRSTAAPSSPAASCSPAPRSRPSVRPKRSPSSTSRNVGSARSARGAATTPASTWRAAMPT